ncbi:MAG TPA: molybdenum cofactor guanylyltransferase [Nitrospira sp.]|nr:molybdenum cofactor guanylyltransferase [Nitrospira sp.]
MPANTIIEHISGVLIAGGKSRRMGRDKRFLTVGGTSLFHRTLGLLAQIFPETIVVLAEPVELLEIRGSRVMYDIIPNAGSLGGLYTGLMAASHPRVFAVACDMPFLNPDVIRFMASFDTTADIVVAKLERGFQPLHALYSRSCIPFLKAMTAKRDFKIQNLYGTQHLRVAVVKPADIAMAEAGLKSFQNVNTLDDLARAEAGLAEES